MEFTSDRLIFNSFEEKDFENYFSLYSNDKVMEMITGKPLTEEESRVRFSGVIETNKQAKSLLSS